MAPTFSYFLEDYPVSHVANQRVIGPVGNCEENPPPGSEIFVGRIPSYYTEKELFPFFSKAGKIFIIRLMMRENAPIFNRGFAYITYTTPEEAKRAINDLPAQNKFPEKSLTIEISHDNCRLYVGGIPEHKTKDEVWKQLLNCGFDGIVEIIMYRSYINRAKNRGYIFVEFETHQKAAQARYLFQNLKLWGSKLTADWSTPLPKLDEDTVANITKLFFRNLNVSDSPEAFKATLHQVLDGMRLGKVYKFKDYGFVHFLSRKDAEEAKEKLTAYYENTFVEIMWATPQEKAPKQVYHTATPKNFNPINNYPQFQLAYLSQSSPSSLEHQQYFTYDLKPINKNPNQIIGFGTPLPDWAFRSQSLSSPLDYQQLSPQYCSTPIKNSNQSINTASPQPKCPSRSQPSSLDLHKYFSATVLNSGYSNVYSSPHPVVANRRPLSASFLDYMHLTRPLYPGQPYVNGTVRERMYFNQVAPSTSSENLTFSDSSFCSSHTHKSNFSAIKDEYLPTNQFCRSLLLSTNLSSPNITRSTKESTSSFSNESGWESGDSQTDFCTKD